MLGLLEISNLSNMNIAEKSYLTLHCTNFGIYKTFTFSVNVLKDPHSIPLLGIYFIFAFKCKGLKGDLFVTFTWCFKDSNVPLCGVFKVHLNTTLYFVKVLKGNCCTFLDLP